MKLLVGLGNPGAKFARNRHNIGYMAIDQIARVHGSATWRNKFSGESMDISINEERCILLKPGTFMNHCGQSVSKAKHYFKLNATDIVVFHDELDLASGKIRVKKGGGHAGHNGLRSIVSNIGPEFVRVRLGINHPGHKDLVHQYVLGNFTKQEINDWLIDTLQAVSQKCLYLVKEDYSAFLNAIAMEKKSTPKENSAIHVTKSVITENKQNRIGDEGWQAKLRRLFGM